MQRLEKWNNDLDKLIDRIDEKLEKFIALLNRRKHGEEAHAAAAAGESGQQSVNGHPKIYLRDIKRTAGRSGWLFVLLTTIWFLGYIGISFGWLLLVLLAFSRKRMWDDELHHERVSLKNAYLVGAEQSDAARNAFLTKLGDPPPSWVYFSESERAEWLNTLIGRIWPYFNKFVEQFMLTNFAEMLGKEMPFSIEFRKVDIGDEPLRIGAIRSYNGPNMAGDEVIIDIEVIYCGDAEFSVSARGLRVGVADLKLRGTLRVTLKPLMDKIPFVGCATIAFINRPDIDFNLTEAADIAERLGLQ